MQNTFEQSLAWAENNGALGFLQFAGATQRGRSWAHDNNQDAYAIVTGPDCFVGVVCDGCSTAPAGYQSHNEVGAKILSKIVSQFVGDTVSKTSVESFLTSFPKHRKEIIRLLSNAVDAICPLGDRDLFIKCYMMSTVLVVATDGEEFCIFGCGDGLFFLDGNMTDLEDESGRYLSSALVEGSSEATTKESHFKVHKSGLLENIRSIMIASDGVADIAGEHPTSLLHFLDGSTDQVASSDFEAGYSPEIIKRFRRRVLKTESYISWIQTQDTYDDRTLVVVENFNIQTQTKTAKLHEPPVHHYRVAEMAAELSRAPGNEIGQGFGSGNSAPAFMKSSATQEMSDASYVELRRREFVHLHGAELAPTDSGVSERSEKGAEVNNEKPTTPDTSELKKKDNEPAIESPVLVEKEHAGSGAAGKAALLGSYAKKTPNPKTRVSKSHKGAMAKNVKRNKRLPKVRRNSITRRRKG